MKLDSRDYQLLWHLDNNSRLPLNHLARHLRISKEAVHYRLNKLESKNIITSYATMVSLAKLGLMHVKLLIKLVNTNKDTKEEIIDYLVKHKNSNWVVSCRGTYSIIAGFVVKDLYEFKNIKQEFSKSFSKNIHSLAISVMIESNIYGRKYLTGELQDIKHYVGTPKLVKLENIDFKILKQLSNNTRINVTQIARNINSTARIVAYRLNKLEKSNVIQKYTISINHNLLGLSFFKAFIYLKETSKANMLLNYLSSQPNCLYNVEVLGQWDLEPEFEVKSNNEYYRIMDEIEDKFSKHIKNINTLLIDKEYKFQLIPEKISGKFE